jgi:hypothetical protein
MGNAQCVGNGLESRAGILCALHAAAIVSIGWVDVKTQGGSRL